MIKILGKSNVFKMEIFNVYLFEFLFILFKEIVMMFNFEEYDKLKVIMLFFNDLDFICLFLKLKVICEKI